VTVCRDNRSDGANGQTTSCESNGKKWNVGGKPYRIVVAEHRGKTKAL
jgi:hypothetical protein